MYILYYHSIDDDHCDFEIIGVSEDPERLHLKRQAILETSRSCREERERYLAARILTVAEQKEKVRAFLEKHQDCLREKRPLSPAQLRGCDLEWHYANGQPYDPEVVAQKKQLVIHRIVEWQWSAFFPEWHAQCNDFLHVDKLDEPLLQLSHSDYAPEPPVVGKYYEPGDLVVEKVETL